MFQSAKQEMAGTREAVAGVAALQRLSGSGRLGIGADAGRSRIIELYQQGSCRLRLPAPAPGAPLEAVTINTGGGLTGGDHLQLAVALEAEAEAVVTSQACEKIYRSAGGEARIESSIDLCPQSKLDWLAQPMIVFDRARIRRTLTVNMAGDARLLAVDGIILGRTAMEEEVAAGSIHDCLRIRRDGRLVLADAFRAGPDIADELETPAALFGKRAVSTIIYCAPDAEARLECAQALVARLDGEAAASAWNGLMLVRLVNEDGQGLIADLTQFLTAFRGQPLPRTWMC